jgi:valyl-tRNA synthetase
MADQTPQKYNPNEIEGRWYRYWMDNGYFRSVPDDREPFTIVMPPPNVTGVLHMGHLLNNTIQDVLIRKARLDGKNALWVPGTDHASIATEAKVVRWLRDEKGLKKSDLTRDEFMTYAYQWKDKYGGIILHQLKRLGASCDWDRTQFTMDPGYYRDVINVFIDLFNKGKLYRGNRMVNWDPEALTVLSNEEVLYSEETLTMCHIHYKQPDGSDGIVVATVRPETIHADAAVAVHPKDPRYKHLVGKMVCIPLTGKQIPVIADTYVERTFGTGALKVTPAHDINDYEIGQRHGLEVIDLITDNGLIAEHCGYQPIVGLERFEARKKVIADLESTGLLVKKEAYLTKVGRSERTNAVVEPKLSLQWFVNMTQLRDPAVAAVQKKAVRFFPDNFRNIYRVWMDGLRDWCISRQLWWGQRVPAWYLAEDARGKETHIFVAADAETALEQARAATGKPHLTLADLRQDEDVLDTWASSWLWPISVFDGFEKPDGEIKYYYPTNVVVTGWDIIFFWIARMIMAGYEFKGTLPFHAVYFTGMVRDSQRRKMSKSLGNSPDSIELIDKFGADGVRYGLLSSSPAGSDLLYEDKLCENGRNFANKIWNAATGAVLGWEVTDKKPGLTTQQANTLALKWIQGRLKAASAEANADFKKFRLSEALKTIYQFIWDDLFSNFLEMVKPPYQQPIDRKMYEATIGVFSQAMVLLHPFMPFITEEVWHKLAVRAAGNDCCMQPAVKPGRPNKDVEHTMAQLLQTLTGLRELRSRLKLKPKDLLDVRVKHNAAAVSLVQTPGFVSLLSKMGFIGSFEVVADDPAGAQSFVAGTTQYFVLLADKIDVEAEKAKLVKEIEYQAGFLKNVMAKLGNERFVANAAPSVVDAERKKAADAEARIALMRESLEKL